LGRLKYAREQLAHLLERILMHERSHPVPVRRAHRCDETFGHLLRRFHGLRLRRACLSRGGLRLGSAGGECCEQYDGHARTHTTSGDDGIRA